GMVSSFATITWAPPSLSPKASLGNQLLIKPVPKDEFLHPRIADDPPNLCLVVTGKGPVDIARRVDVLLVDGCDHPRQLLPQLSAEDLELDRLDVGTGHMFWSTGPVGTHTAQVVNEPTCCGIGEGQTSPGGWLLDRLPRTVGVQQLQSEARTQPSRQY